MIRKVINKITSSFGFKIISIRPEKLVSFQPGNKPFLIEFTGVAGVGKSTLYHELKKDRKKWVEAREFIKRNPELNTNTILDGTFYQKIADLKFQIISKKEIPSADKFRIIHWGYTTLLEDAAANLYHSNSTILFEEGLLHNFGDALEILFDDKEFDFNEIIKNRALIYCYNSPPIIAAQIENRKKETGRIVSHHKNKSTEELIELIQEEIQKKENFASLMKALNVPVLMIDTSENQQQNLVKINAFIEALQSEKSITP